LMAELSLRSVIRAKKYRAWKGRTGEAAPNILSRNFGASKANDRHEVDELHAGDIAACVGLKDVTTGDTLCDPDAVITLERM
ncbi:hypothetical protein INR17_30025, partial [Klebsiella pneumoniae]|nr:hypothetical protein [Klebsiella pneumoniae]